MSYVARLSRQGRRLAAERATAGRRSPVLVAAFALVGLVAAGLILVEAFAAQWELRAPDQALSVNPRDALALAVAAQNRLDGQGGPAAVDAAEKLAMASLRAQSLNAPALRVLGQVAAARGDHARAVSLFQAAAHWTRRDTIANASLLDDSLRRGDVAGAVRQADMILRYAPDVSPAVFPALAQMAGDPRSQPALAHQLATRPAWRPSFLTFLAEKLTDPAVALDVMAKMADDGAPATDEEVTPLLTRMVEQHRFVDAYVAWQQFLPASATRMRANVRDGDFDGQPGAAPFGWKFENGPGTSAQVLQGPIAGSGGSALKVSYDGVSTATPARQLLVLGPGKYRLSARIYVSAQRLGAHLAWTVRCAEDDQSLAATPDAALEPGWNAVVADFQVPDGGCEGQWLSLTAIPGERTDDIEVWYDGVDVRRVPVPAS